MADKSTVRREAKRRLTELTPELRADAAEFILSHVWELPELAAARTILLYASLPEEVPTRAIAAEARSRGIDVVYPRCLPEGREMSLHLVSSPDELLRPGRYGILEPAEHCPTTNLEEIDFAFIPGLAFDRARNRLGRGAGYYDRLLASPAWRAFRCGIFFAIQEFPAIPTDPWDVRLDAVVTEQGVCR